MASDKTLIVAMRHKSLAILAAESQANIDQLCIVTQTDVNKTFKVSQNIHYGCSGDEYCAAELSTTLSNVDFANANSVMAVATLVTDQINAHHADNWAEKGSVLRLLMVGNVINTDEYHIFRIQKGVQGNAFALEEIHDPIVTIGCGTPAVADMVADYQHTFTADNAFDVAFLIVRYGTLRSWPVGGEIRILTFLTDRVDSNVVGQDDPRYCTSDYTTITETTDDPNDPDEVSITYRI